MAISRPWGRIRGYHAQKGRRGVWVPLSLVWGRRVGSAVEAGRRRRSQAMCCEVWRWLNSCLAGWKGRVRSKLPGWLKWAHALKVAWLIEMGAHAQSCLVDWNGRTRSKLPGWLKWAHALKVRGLVIFFLLLVAAKSWRKTDPLAVIHYLPLLHVEEGERESAPCAHALVLLVLDFQAEKCDAFFLFVLFSSFLGLLCFFFAINCKITVYSVRTLWAEFN